MKKMFFFILGFIILLFIIIKFSSQRSTSSISSLPEIDYILVEKKNRILYVYHRNKIIKKYNIALGVSPIGHKEKEGDGKTPKGKYYISYKNPKSRYHLSLKISYPSEKNRLYAEEKEINPGDNVMIHSLRNGFGWIGDYHRLIDWTQGCIAMNSQEIEEIYHATKVGTVIEIKP